MQRDSRPFSQRFGHRPAEAEITVREDAPEALRQGVVMLATAVSVRARGGNFPDYGGVGEVAIGSAG